MGAAIALLPPPHPDVVAIIADSSYAHLDMILRSFVHWQLMEQSNSWSHSLRWLRSTFQPLCWIMVAFSRLVFRLRFGHALIARPAGSMKRWRVHRQKSQNFHIPPILLIHGTDDKFVSIVHAHQIVKHARMHNIPMQTYFAEGSNHSPAPAHNPHNNIQTIQSFVAQYLGNAYPGASLP